jgi:HEAT repeat protein
MIPVDDLNLEVMTRVVELVELRGQARHDSRSALDRLQHEQDIVPVLLELVQGDDLGYSHRAAAAALLADWRDHRVLPVLQELADSGIEALQEIALSTLFRFGDPDGTDRIMALLDHEDRNLAGRACDYLGASRPARVVAPLAQIIDGDDPVLRHRAVEALVHHGSSEAHATLKAHMVDEDDPELRAVIRQALARCKE